MDSAHRRKVDQPVSNPTSAWLPSQKGLLSEAPQRQSAPPVPRDGLLIGGLNRDGPLHHERSVLGGPDVERVVLAVVGRGKVVDRDTSGVFESLIVASVTEGPVAGAAAATERHARVGEQRVAVAIEQFGVAVNEKGPLGNSEMRFSSGMGSGAVPLRVRWRAPVGHRGTTASTASGSARSDSIQGRLSGLKTSGSPSTQAWAWMQRSWSQVTVTSSPS